MLNCLIFLYYMKSICLWVWKITIENVITLLQVLSSSFIFLTFAKCQTAPPRLKRDPMQRSDTFNYYKTVHMQNGGITEVHMLQI